MQNCSRHIMSWYKATDMWRTMGHRLRQSLIDGYTPPPPCVRESIDCGSDSTNSILQRNQQICLYMFLSNQQYTFLSLTQDLHASLNDILFAICPHTSLCLSPVALNRIYIVDQIIHGNHEQQNGLSTDVKSQK